MSDSICYYPCGPKYCSTNYSRKIEHIVEPIFLEFKEKFENIVQDVVQDKNAVYNILNNTDISLSYYPGADNYHIGSLDDLYEGPGIWFNVEYRYEDRKEDIYIERNLYYCYLYDNSQDSIIFNFNDDNIDKDNIYQCYLVEDLNMIFYKLSKFKSKKLTSILKPYITEFRRDMDSIGETRV